MKRHRKGYGPDRWTISWEIKVRNKEASVYERDKRRTMRRMDSRQAASWTAREQDVVVLPV